MQTIQLEKLDVKEGHKVLDLGCGHGRHCHAVYYHEDCQIIGVDLGFNDILIAREGFAAYPDLAGQAKSNFGLGVADALHLPFADNTFDRVICSEVLEHIPDYLTAIDEIFRVTKPSGRIGISVPRFWPEKICWLLSADYHNEPGGHIRIFRANELEEDFTLRGFKKIAQHWAHSLHTPYWWLRCLLGVKKDKAFGVRHYHKLLVAEMMNPKGLVAGLGKLLDPIMGKSVVYYFDKK